MPPTSVSRNALYNLIGHGALLVAGVVTVPLLTRALGVERFGLLSLVRVLVIYFSILDFGFTSAVTQRVAEAVGRGESDRVPAIFHTATVFLFWMGILGGGLLALAAPLLVTRVLDVPPALHAEGIQSLTIAALAFPLVTLTSSVTGMLQGLQRFGRINMVLAPMNIAQFVLPLGAAWMFGTLPAAVAAIFLSRGAAYLALRLFVREVTPRVEHRPHYSRTEFRSLFQFGKWMTVSNLVSPIIGYTDRVFLGIVRPIDHLTYYTVPADIANRLQVFPKSLLVALYPVLSGMNDTEKMRDLGLRSLRLILVLLVPGFLTVILFSHELLTLWMGAAFAERSTMALQIVVPGMAAAALSLAPQYVLQSQARTDLIGKIHVWLSVAYVPLAFPVILYWGVEGAALMWTLRSVAEAVWMVQVVYPISTLEHRRALGIMVGPFALIFSIQLLLSALAWLLLPSLARSGAWLGIALVAQIAQMRVGLAREDRQALWGLVRPGKSRKRLA